MLVIGSLQTAAKQQAKISEARSKVQIVNHEAAPRLTQVLMEHEKIDVSLAEDEAQAMEALEGRLIHAFVRIPDDFRETLDAKGQEQVTIVYDGSRSPSRATQDRLREKPNIDDS